MCRFEYIFIASYVMAVHNILTQEKLLQVAWEE